MAYTCGAEGEDEDEWLKQAAPALSQPAANASDDSIEQVIVGLMQ